MKKIITLIYILTIFSCSKEKSNIQQKINIIKEPKIISKKDSVVFLNYKLGSSLNDFNVHTKKLLVTKKLKKDNNKLIYSFPTKNEKIKNGFLESKFFKKQLYELDLILTNYRKKNDCFLFFKNHLTKKYGIPYEFEDYNSSPDNNYIARVIAFSKTYVPINQNGNYFYIRTNKWIFKNGFEIKLEGYFHANNLKNFTNEMEDEVIISYIDNNFKKEKSNSIINKTNQKIEEQNIIIENDL